MIIFQLVFNHFAIFTEQSLPDANMFGHKEGYRRVVVSKQDGTGWALASGSIHNITASSIFLCLSEISASCMHAYSL